MPAIRGAAIRFGCGVWRKTKMRWRITIPDIASGFIPKIFCFDQGGFIAPGYTIATVDVVAGNTFHPGYLRYHYAKIFRHGGKSLIGFWQIIITTPNYAATMRVQFLAHSHKLFHLLGFDDGAAGLPKKYARVIAV